MRANKEHVLDKEMATTAPEPQDRTCKVITKMSSIRKIATTAPDSHNSGHAR